MPLSFPPNPTLNQTTSTGGRSWKWDGEGWSPFVTSGGSGGSSITAIYNTATTSTGYFSLPSGSTIQRPENPQPGMVRYNQTTGFAEVYSALGWGIFGNLPPAITSVTPGSFNGEQGTQFTINGNNFNTDAVVRFITLAGVEHLAASVSYVSSTILVATTPRDFTVADEPLGVRVSQASGTISILNAIDCGGVPSWTTAAGSLGTFLKNDSVSISVAATDPDTNATITYTTSSVLPGTLSLNSGTGAITGTAPSPLANTTYNFNLNAADNAGNTTQRAFSITVAGNQIYKPAGTTRLAAYTFDGANVINAESGGFSHTLYGSLNYTLGGPQNSTYYAGGWSVGTNYILVSGMGPLSTNNYTLIAWYRGTQLGTASQSIWQATVTIFGDHRGSVYAGVGLDSGKISIGCNGQTKGTTTVADGNWHCLAWAWRSNRYIDAYVDGVLEVTADLVSLSSNNQAYIRMDYIGSGYTGYAQFNMTSPTALDGIQIYDGTLTSSQILQIATGG